MLSEIKTVFQKEFNYFLENARERSEQRKLQQAQRKAEEVQQQKALAKQHLLETKRYFMASFLDFFVVSQGDVYELFPHRRYKFHNLSKGVVLDVRTKVRSMDKAKRKKLEKDLLSDFNACEENFWQYFAQISNLQFEEIERMSANIDALVARAYEEDAKGILTTSKRLQYKKDIEDFRCKLVDLQNELALRWEIWNTHFSITNLLFRDGFLEFEIHPER